MTKMKTVRIDYEQLKALALQSVADTFDDTDGAVGFLLAAFSVGSVRYDAELDVMVIEVDEALADEGGSFEALLLKHHQL